MGLLATALGLSLFASLPPHGGVYAPPAGPVAAPGAGGVRVLGPTVSSGPSTGAPTLASAPTTPGGSSGPDLALWTYWWQHNQAPFLNVKAHVRGVDGRTGSDGWFLGEGQKDQALSLRPSVPQVRDQIVPALLTVLEQESDSSLVSGALVALGKIGPDGSTQDAERFEAACVKLLADANQEVRETAALALGILGHGRAVPYLAHLLWDSKTAQRWVGAREVDYRTRAFAAFGLAQVGARSESTSERESIVKILREALAADETKTPDLAAACVIALGLVPLPEDEDGAAADPAAPRTGRAEQLEHLLAWFEDDEHHRTARAHCPTALARLCIEVRGPAAVALRARIANVLAERIERGKEPAEVLQSCVQALGTLATNGDGALDVRLRRALTLVDQRVSEPQARAFALMAMAEAGGRFGTDTPSGVGEARDFLVHELVFGKNALLPWSALGCGVLAWNLRGDPGQAAALESLQRAVRATLQDARAPERIGASALAAGLAGDLGSTKMLLKRLDDELPDDARGHVALGLALLGEQGALEPLRALVARSKYHPELLRSCAIALGILGDKDVVPQLAAMLVEARSLASQAAIASAFGFIGDHRAVDPLLKLLTSPTATAKARAFAAVALGNVADKEDWPWNAKIALGLNYRAATGTLTDPVSASGVLDIL